MLARAKRKGDRSPVSIESREIDLIALDLPDSRFDAAVASFFDVLPDALQVPGITRARPRGQPGGITRLLNHVRPRSVVRGVITKLWQPCVARVFGASFDRQTEKALPEAGLLLVEFR
jgi:hypothetical protein